tara:strand:- start:211 stop:432 length:222 start_codon:yes stop_codon:yes gene_type:complete
MKDFYLAVALLLGTIDRIEGDIVVASITSSDNSTESFEMPVEMFPCEISEGDVFYFSYSEGVTEIRCGEPEPG